MTKDEILREIASELRRYIPAADEYKGQYIHKGWADKIEKTIAQPEMRKATREEKISNPGVYEVPVQPAELGLLAKRRIFDAIRSAYDLGYNDARSTKAVSGDSAPGYKGREVEADHGGALLSSLNKNIAQQVQSAQELEAVATLTEAPTVWDGDQWQQPAVVNMENFVGSGKPVVLAEQGPNLAEAFRTELDKLSQRNYELRMENARLKSQPEQEPTMQQLAAGAFLTQATGFTSPPKRQPLTHEKQIAEDLRFHGLQLVKTVTGYAVLKLGQVAAHDIGEKT